MGRADELRFQAGERVRMSTVESPALSSEEASTFLLREARLLDELRLDEWLALFAPDSLYWVPIAEPDDGGPARNTSLIRDGDVRRQERVFRLLSTPLPSQTPPSRTLHLISNVAVEPTEQRRVRVHSN
ncbi:MAG: hypothetical protein GEV00_23985, partial [Actinophytocola sp.]|nr:hypothetical protein [Actinophytocola sp.]